MSRRVIKLADFFRIETLRFLDEEFVLKDQEKYLDSYDLNIQNETNSNAKYLSDYRTKGRIILFEESKKSLV